MSILRTELAAAAALAHRELGDRPRALPELEELTATPAETMFYRPSALLSRLGGGATRRGSH